MWWLVGVAAGILTAWGLLIVGIYVRRPAEGSPRESLRLVPDTIRLVRRLATDKRVPTSARVALWLLGAYLVSPIDLVPDFLPVIGYADDAILVALVLRFVVRRAGAAVVTDRWPGTPRGLDALCALAGIRQT